MLTLKVGYAACVSYVAYIASEEKFGSSEYYLRKDGTLHTNTGGVDLGWWKDKQEAQQFLDNWMPQKEWLTRKEVQAEAKKGLKEALWCSIQHWRQGVLNLEEFIAGEGRYFAEECALCQYDQQNAFADRCEICPMNPIKCCFQEWEDFYDNPTLENAIKVLNVLTETYNKQFGERKMSNMINIDGVEVSKDTIKNALDKAGIKLEKEYVPEAGDIIMTCYNDKRIVICDNGKFATIDENGKVVTFFYNDSKGIYPNCKKIGKLIL